MLVVIYVDVQYMFVVIKYCDRKKYFTIKVQFLQISFTLNSLCNYQSGSFANFSK